MAKAPAEKPVIDRDTLTEAIVKIAGAVRTLNRGGLNQKAVVVLLQDATKLPKKTIQLVLNELPMLERKYLR